MNLENKIRSIIQEHKKTNIAAHENGHQVDIDVIPQDQEIVLFEQKWMEELARHNEIYNQSVSLDWQELDPAEDGTKGKISA
jgi:hypothetical protein